MTADARQEYAAWFNIHNARASMHRGDYRAALAKLEEYGPRLALVLALMRDPAATAVDAAAIRAGCRLADWFAVNPESLPACP
jgi:hypothetical protein